MEIKKQPLTLKELETYLEKPKTIAEREKETLSVRALAARELYELSQKNKLREVTESELEELLNGLEINDLEYLAILQAKIREIIGAELKPVNAPQVYELILKAWTTLKNAQKNPNIDKKELNYKKEFFFDVYSLIINNPIYRNQIKNLPKPTIH